MKEDKKREFTKILDLEKEEISQLAGSEMTHAKGGIDSIQLCYPGPYTERCEGGDTNTCDILSDCLACQPTEGGC